jgi:serine/threonine-protein kinase
VTGEIVCGYRLLRELGARALPTYAAIAPKPRNAGEALCVVERFAREPGVNAEAAAEFLRDAKRLEHLHHPNVIRVRDVVVGTSTVLLVSDWVEGEALSEVEAAAASKGVAIPLAARLRILVDVLEGLAALHELRDARREPMKLVHGEVAPRNVIVDMNGRSVLAHPLRAPGALARQHGPAVVGHLAPEVLLGDQTVDQRADVFGAGVILWEALMGRRMHPDGEDVGEVVMRLLGGKIELATAPADAPWAAALAEAAKKATSPDPSMRFANAAMMLTEVRRAIGPRLAAKSLVASIVDAAVGEHVRARALVLRPAASAPVATAPTSATSASPEDAPPVSVPIAREPPVEATTPAVVVSPAPAAHEGASALAGSEGSAKVGIGDDEPASIPVVVSTSVPPPSSRPPSSEDIVEVIEMELPPDKPARPRQPPPFRPHKPVPHTPPKKRADTAELRAEPSVIVDIPPPPLPRATTPTKTDLASISLVSTPAASMSAAKLARAKWVLAAACAVGLGVLAWIIIRGGAERSASTDAPLVSSAMSAAEAIAPPDPSAPAASPAREPAPPSSATAPAASTPGPFDPPVPAPAGSSSATQSSAPSAPAHQSPTPAASSPHAKKRVYDPMGI